MSMKQQSSQFLEHEKIPVKDMGINQSENTWHMGLNDLTIPSKEIIQTMEYAYNLFQEERETQNINENKPRLWFWNNVSFVFSIGAIFEANDHQVFDQIMLYFDKHEDAFLPNKVLVQDYKNSKIVENIERYYDIGSGNYHLLMAIIVTSDDDLNNAPESIYQRYGPVFGSVNMVEIVDTMIEVFTKYGAVKQFLGPTIKGTLGISYDMSKSGTTGMPREYLRDDSVRRMYRKGFLDFEANDGYEEVNPMIIHHPDSVRRQWFNEEQEGTNFRKSAKIKSRNGTSQAPIKRTNTQNSLYNQLHNPVEIIQTPHISDMKAVQYKMDFYKETIQNRQDKPNYELYTIDGYDTMSNSDKYIANATSTDQSVICPHISINYQE